MRTFGIRRGRRRLPATAEEGLHSATYSSSHPPTLLAETDLLGRHAQIRERHRAMHDAGASSSRYWSDYIVSTAHQRSRRRTTRGVSFLEVTGDAFGPSAASTTTASSSERGRRRHVDPAPAAAPRSAPRAPTAADRADDAWTWRARRSGDRDDEHGSSLSRPQTGGAQHRGCDLTGRRARRAAARLVARLWTYRPATTGRGVRARFGRREHPSQPRATMERTTAPGGGVDAAGRRRVELGDEVALLAGVARRVVSPPSSRRGGFLLAPYVEPQARGTLANASAPSR